LQFFLAARAQRQLGAFGRESQRDSLAEALARSGNYSDATF
jgi:hypothetical protein